MLFGTVILLVAAGIAFYHYVQGLFSAMISASLAVLAALLAISFHEIVAERYFATSFPVYAHAVALVGLFALSYVLMRLVADRLIPGNVRYPVMVEKIGAGVFGFIAGCFATGILALAAQLLPTGPSIAGYTRFAIDDREVSGVKIPGRYQRQDLMISGELKNDTLQSSRSSSLFPIPADGMVLGLVGYVSDGGSLAGDRPFGTVHPSYPDELFGHRMGPHFGADVVIGAEGSAGITVGAVYTADSVLSDPRDLELKEVRGGQAPQFVPDSSQMPVVVRATIEAPGSAGANSFNMGSVRLVVAGRDYYPVGSYQKGQYLALTRLDDFLFADTNAPVDFVFMVDTEVLPVKEGTDQRVFPQRSFIEARRAARADLSGMAIGTSVPSGSGSVGIVEKDPRSQN